MGQPFVIPGARQAARPLAARPVVARALGAALAAVAALGPGGRPVGAQQPAPVVTPISSPAEPTFVTLTGVVRSKGAGTPVSGAEVSFIVGPMQRRTTTGDDGVFTLPNVPQGAVKLSVRRIGFRPDSFHATAPATQLALVVEPIPQKLSAVVVNSRKRGPYTGPHADFLRRMDNGHGKYITREDIVKRNAMRSTDLLRTIPGVWIVGDRGSGMQVPRFRNSQCNPLIWIDGAPAYAGYFDIDAISPETLEGMEIYPGTASTPMELRGRNGEERCGVIALWTRMPTRAPKQKGKRVTAEELAAFVAAAQLYTAEQVDVAVRPDSTEPVIPIYPDSLKRAKVGGAATVEFVVDTAGQVETETIGLVTATHPLFASAARDAIRRASFYPAQRQGRFVRQLVQLTVEFDSTR